MRHNKDDRRGRTRQPYWCRLQHISSTRRVTFMTSADFLLFE